MVSGVRGLGVGAGNATSPTWPDPDIKPEAQQARLVRVGSPDEVWSKKLTLAHLPCWHDYHFPNRTDR
jgi:hypothetical protein